MFSEITVQIMFSKQQAIAALGVEGFKFVRKRQMHDVYFTHLPRGTQYEYKKLISNSVMLRKLSGDNDRIVYKQKFFDEKGNVFSEDKLHSPIESWGEVARILSLANFHMWCEKQTELHVFERDRRQIVLQDVKDLGLFLEIEGDSYTKSIDDLIAFAKSFRLPLGDDFHVKLPYLLYLKTLE